MPPPSSVPYASFLRYSPRGTSPSSVASRGWVAAVKGDGLYGRMRAIDVSASKLAQELSRYTVLSDCLAGGVLVPAPRSAPQYGGGLWPTKRLCEAMVAAGVGTGVFPALRRTLAVQKSATAARGQRPTVRRHYETIAVEQDRSLLAAGTRLVVVDDVVTRGATFLACHRRLSEAYPDAAVCCFALTRTISDAEVGGMLDPVAGVITLEPLHREP
ncbi:MAG: hypothetical protein JWO31_4053 [Phycisphaerales bacterium]|nr:hypothetical protein [Phycisphaerales bacterium]